MAVAAGLLDAYGGDRNSDIRTVAIACVAASHIPDVVPELLKSSYESQRTIGLVVAEWVPTAEVLEALLAMPVPALPKLKLQYARSLAAMGDAATLPHLQALRAADENGELSEPIGLAEALLRVSI